MKLLTTLGLLATTSLALHFAGGPTPDGPTPDAAPETGAPETGAPETGAPETGAPDGDAGDACCEGGGSPQSSAPRVSYLELADPLPDDVKKGKVRGVVKFAGEERPEITPLTIGEEAAKGCTDGPPVDNTNKSLLIDEDGGIRYAVVTISVEGAKVKLPEDPIVLDQVQCRFDPHVMLVPAGATVEYKNSDTISHNVHTKSVRNPSFNKMVAAGASDSQKLTEPEAIKIECDIHPWMLCWLFVTDTPYGAVTAPDGSFEIAGLPPGSYRVDVWHERLGRTRSQVTVHDDGKADPLEIEMSEGAPAGRRPPRRR